MNRTLDQAAAVLGIGPRKLRARMRDLGLLNHAGELISTERGQGRLFVDTRARWNRRINGYSHYGVVMATEAGIAWLAKQLDITVTQKDAAA
ncbi:hypothetical protein DN820_01940 [Stutzerimonas nosocomialis]|uniref:Antirepressor protein C-terminal domain-containing protein n=1 Tax=Stutzerimonas nosocomialis TaxID=1056496 RepID=A0A5R9QIH8_9GAMM|nr:hypothetical protein [Stutzerimonas nosocomialis]TLX65096.1 hypothetical protein DN820_01940 [Stutzerimonas nosocomialis]